MKVTSLDCRQLRKLLRKEPSRCLVLDCRPYLSYSASCLRGSLNVNLNSVVMRRARGGAAHRVLPNALPSLSAMGKPSRHRRQGPDQAAGTPRLGSVRAMAARHAQRSGRSLGALPGARAVSTARGYETFNSQYPECCVDGKLLSPERSDTERSTASPGVPPKPAYDQGGPVEILPFLYLGSAYHASKCEFLANLHITALLNVSRRSSEPFTDQYCYKWIPVEDSHAADISSHFQEAIDFIDCVRRAGGKILVHCEAGISRSPTICMAYLMKTKRLRLEEAFDYVKQRRSLISPNFGFMGQLLQYESEILSSTPSPPVASCKREAVSFFAEELTLGKSFEGSCFAFPTSVLTSVPIHSPVHQLKLSPMTASSSC
ncbi:Dual specificity protein phosphatase 5 [Tinamus guttatus]|uniref:Dual specificity protein phosphatase n=1 Tax=Tinamus guttatus TaxID=94827 RepID=A0A099Z1K2_TINGU|nr:Dual specificity protein phosphatase 5 [Tinamus guttatus]